MFRNGMASIKSDTHRLLEDTNVPKEETNKFSLKKEIKLLLLPIKPHLLQIQLLTQQNN